MKTLLRISGVILLAFLIFSCEETVTPTLITTTDATEISYTTATTGGDVTNEGGVPIISRGVCWNISEDPTIDNSKTMESGGMGAFTSSITKLTPNTIYYVRAYATNIDATIYGNEVSFTTGPGTVNDIDGNTYNSVEIGNQVWMAQNLKTTKYNDGTPIPVINRGLNWKSMTTPAYYLYNDDATNKRNTYGALYNWYTVNTGKLCPKRWHVPTDSEWKVLEINIMMDLFEVENIGWRGTNQGDKLKNTNGWHLPDNGTNTTGFSALPGGSINNTGELVSVEINGNWWSSTELYEENAYYRTLYYNESKLARYNTYKVNGFSVRCIKD
jgi:uncharacterized protein (TIGR02145 family)